MAPYNDTVPGLESKLTFGAAVNRTDYKKATCHRIAGSFHWELKLNGIAYGTEKTRVHFRPK